VVGVRDGNAVEVGGGDDTGFEVGVGAVVEVVVEYNPHCDAMPVNISAYVTLYIFAQSRQLVNAA
jgi:hypothetical protein